MSQVSGGDHRATCVRQLDLLLDKLQALPAAVSGKSTPTSAMPIQTAAPGVPRWRPPCTTCKT